MEVTDNITMGVRELGRTRKDCYRDGVAKFAVNVASLEARSAKDDTREIGGGCQIIARCLWCATGKHGRS